jgi:hypothetical protein
MIEIVIEKPSSGGAWLEQLQAMRGRVLYQGGKRPQFRAADGRYVDSDPLDPLSYHVLGLVAGEIVACWRLFVVDRAEPLCLTEQLLGRSRFETALATLGVTRAACGEAGRWIVDPSQQQIGVGRRLVAAGLALSRSLGLREIIATVGTKDGQDRALVRAGTGAVPVPGIEPLHSNAFSDRVVVMHASPRVKDPSFKMLVDEMAEALDLGSGSALDSYEKALAPARARLARGRALTRVLADDVPEDLLEAFLVDFCARGVGMTEPVEGWIRRAGERCRERGAKGVGDRLVGHARAEAGHHLLMVADTRHLAARWNARRGSDRDLDADRLLARAPSPAVARYARLHEEVIAGSAPFAQVAIELEIEALSLTHGADFVKQCVRRLEPAIVDCLSFVREHVAADVGHSEFNRRELTRLLEEDAVALGPLVAAGSEALDAYGAFLDECLDFALERTSVLRDAIPIAHAA